MADFTDTGASGIISSLGQKLAPPISKRDINTGLSEYGLKPTSLKGKSDSDLYKMAQDTVINWYKSKKAKPAAAAAPAPKSSAPKPKTTTAPKPKTTTAPKPKTTGTSNKGYKATGVPAPKPKPVPKPAPVAKASVPNYTGKMGLL